MSFFRKFQKGLKIHHYIALAGIIGLIVLICQNIKRKEITDEAHAPLTPAEYTHPLPSNPEGENGDFGNIEETPVNLQVDATNPEELLPVDQNNEWSKLNPIGTGDLNNVNLLKAGFHTGIDTVGSSLRNANLQVRSEHPNPTNNVSPWMNTTIEPDTMRVPLELGNSTN